jgi:DNA-binding YbaB/EbfC family protein
MNNMQQMIMQAKKAQEDVSKAIAKINEQEFSATMGGGAVKVAFTGDKNLTCLEIDKELLAPENKDMIEEMIGMAINKVFEQIDEATDAVQSMIPANLKGML